MHGPEDEEVTWTAGAGEIRRLELADKELSFQKELQQRDSIFDLSGVKKPMPIFLRHRFRYLVQPARPSEFLHILLVSDLLSQVEGGSELWANKDKLSELRWKREILKVICGKSPPCEQLRGLVLRYYRGTSDLSLQKWSGVDHHLTKVFVRSYVLFLLTFVYISGTVRHST